MTYAVRVKGASERAEDMRARFSVAEVAARALEIVDRDGLDGLSMRTLAAALGTGPMTVYNYVKDRNHLEAGRRSCDRQRGIACASQDWRRTCVLSRWRSGRPSVVTPMSCRWS